uniref:Uncharacterized protein n=1 Tax=Branchiostoma floridae TaxID=7739 RepID=C3Z3E9_BRAFL|eukprot:XP_002596981.1 hypothetical protein BRAFLDRAFT_76480 [Branchiostoma floridae]
MPTGQVVNNALYHQASTSQNTQADDQEGCSIGQETDLDSRPKETIPDTTEPYAVSPYVFDVPEHHIEDVEVAGKISPKETELGIKILPGPETQACDHTGQNEDVTDDDTADNQMSKSDTECCLNEGKANTIEPYARSPYVFDVPQYHLGEVEIGDKASPEKEEGPSISTDESTQNNDQAYHNGEGVDKNGNDDIKQWFDDIMASGL